MRCPRRLSNYSWAAAGGRRPPIFHGPWALPDWVVVLKIRLAFGLRRGLSCGLRSSCGCDRCFLARKPASPALRPTGPLRPGIRLRLAHRFRLRGLCLWAMPLADSARLAKKATAIPSLPPLQRCSSNFRNSGLAPAPKPPISVLLPPSATMVSAPPSLAPTLYAHRETELAPINPKALYRGSRRAHHRAAARHRLDAEE